ncbi:MAG: hypothetical protein HC884_06115 [Chloroflexaceae bacterium]|nr:hypothetical protein [Chloroflexaceae bacterium]
MTNDEQPAIHGDQTGAVAKMFLPLLLLLLSLLLTGCAGSPLPPSGDPESGEDETASALQESGAETPRSFQKVRVVDQGFAQERTSFGFSRVVYTFIAENPNPDAQALDTTYQVTLLGKMGVTLREEQVILPVHPPGQFLGITNEVVLDQPVSVTRIKVTPRTRTFQPTSLTESETLPVFAVEQVGFRNRSTAYGVIRSPYLDREVTSVQVSALAYDANYRLVGGGHTIIERIPPGQHVVVDVDLTTSRAPYGGVTLYATLSGASELQLASAEAVASAGAGRDVPETPIEPADSHAPAENGESLSGEPLPPPPGDQQEAALLPEMNEPLDLNATDVRDIPPPPPVASAQESSDAPEDSAAPEDQPAPETDGTGETGGTGATEPGAEAGSPTETPAPTQAPTPETAGAATTQPAGSATTPTPTPTPTTTSAAGVAAAATEHRRPPRGPRRQLAPRPAARPPRRRRPAGRHQARPRR